MLTYHWPWLLAHKTIVTSALTGNQSRSNYWYSMCVCARMHSSTWERESMRAWSPNRLFNSKERWWWCSWYCSQFSSCSITRIFAPMNHSTLGLHPVTNCRMHFKRYHLLWYRGDPTAQPLINKINIKWNPMKSTEISGLIGTRITVTALYKEE